MEVEKPTIWRIIFLINSSENKTDELKCRTKYTSGALVQMVKEII